MNKAITPNILVFMPHDLARFYQSIADMHEFGAWVRVDDLDVLAGPAWQSMKNDCDLIIRTG